MPNCTVAEKPAYGYILGFNLCVWNIIEFQVKYTSIRVSALRQVCS
jgi:hypothetical protein